MIKIINNTNRPHVYIIRNLYNGMYYFGVHNGSKTNTYTGSSKQLNAEITVYGEHNFEKEILYTFNTVEEAYLMEGAIVDWDKVRDPMCYNKQLGGYGGGKSGKGAADIHIQNDYTQNDYTQEEPQDTMSPEEYAIYRQAVLKEFQSRIQNYPYNNPPSKINVEKVIVSLAGYGLSGYLLYLQDYPIGIIGVFITFIMTRLAYDY